MLRDMAGCMRADAMKGKMPNEYGGSLYAAAADTQRLPRGRLVLCGRRTKSCGQIPNTSRPCANCGWKVGGWDTRWTTMPLSIVPPSIVHSRTTKT